MTRFAIGLLAASLLLQGKPLERKFRQGETEKFNVELVVRTEVTGTQAQKIGARAYSSPLTLVADASAIWTTTRRVVSVAEDGSALIEESVSEFAGMYGDLHGEATTEEEKLRRAVRLALAQWCNQPRVLRYRESRFGQISGLAADAGPWLDTAPPLLNLWLARALRPAAALPQRPHAIGEKWSESRSAEIAPWTNVRGSEEGEWLAGPLPQLSIVRFDNLLVTQQISATVPVTTMDGTQPRARGSEANAAVTQPKDDNPMKEGQGRFHAESLSTVVGAGAEVYGPYGALVQAVRSASREVSRTLERVEGLPEAPKFRSVISVEVRITREGFPPKP